MHYVRGGAAWAGDKYTVTGAGFGFEGLDWRGGWTVGTGIEWAFTPNWSARLECDYYGLDTRTAVRYHGDAATMATQPARGHAENKRSDAQRQGHDEQLTDHFSTIEAFDIGEPRCNR